MSEAVAPCRNMRARVNRTCRSVARGIGIDSRALKATVMSRPYRVPGRRETAVSLFRTKHPVA